MANTQVNDFLSDSGWDGDYFYILQDDLMSFKSDTNSTDFREFLFSLLYKAENVYSNQSSSGDQSTKMIITKNVEDSNTLRTETYNVKFTENVNNAATVYDVPLDGIRFNFSAANTGCEQIHISASLISDGGHNWRESDGDEYFETFGWIWDGPSNSNPRFEGNNYEDDYNISSDIGDAFEEGNYSFFYDGSYTGLRYVRPFFTYYSFILQHYVRVYGNVIAVTITDTEC